MTRFTIRSPCVRSPDHVIMVPRVPLHDEERGGGGGGGGGDAWC